MFPFWGIQLNAQDLHFTQNHFPSIYFNPAQTGAFLGTYRINALYRDQNRSFFGTAYQTPILTIDSPIMFGFRKNDWVGAGITLFNDKAGVSGYASTGFLGSLAYHLGLDKKMKHVLTVGARYGFVSRSIDPEAGDFGDELAGLTRSPDRTFLQDFNDGYTSLSVGAMFKSQLSKTMSLEIGAAGIHLIAGTYTFMMSSAQNESSLRLNGHANLNIRMNEQLVLAPTVYYSNESTSTNLVVQLNSAFRIKKMKKGDKKEPFTLYPGIGMRVGDALQFMIGAKVKKYKVGIAYDYSINDYNAFTTSGALEVGIQRIFEIKKKPEIKPIIFCPRI
jgi:type IX secretion system PorP/SprF family membrane protein